MQLTFTAVTLPTQGASLGFELQSRSPDASQPVSGDQELQLGKQTVSVSISALITPELSFPVHSFSLLLLLKSTVCLVFNTLSHTCSILILQQPYGDIPIS